VKNGYTHDADTHLNPRFTMYRVIKVADIYGPYSNTHDRDDLQADHICHTPNSLTAIYRWFNDLPHYTFELTQNFRIRMVIK